MESDTSVSSIDTHEELDARKDAMLMDYDEEFRDDAALMKEMGLPLSFFRSPNTKPDEVTFIKKNPNLLYNSLDAVYLLCAIGNIA